jgi:HKD family nuclease
MKTTATIVYSTQNKTFCITSLEIAQAMLFMGNEHDFNRATSFPQSSVAEMRDTFEANGFTHI